jgi:hypothetical protein
MNKNKSIPNAGFLKFRVLLSLSFFCFAAVTLAIAGSTRGHGTSVSPINPRKIQAAPNLASAVSRLTHGNGAGTFDLPLSLSSRTVEPRSDNSGNFTIVFTFDQAINSGSAMISPNSAHVSNVTFSGSDMIVNVAGITDQQSYTISVSGVTGGTGSGSGSVQVGFLAGDGTQDGVVNIGDTIVTRNASGTPIDATNFRLDMNLDGLINLGDVMMVRSHSGNFLP